MASKLPWQGLRGISWDQLTTKQKFLDYIPHSRWNGNTYPLSALKVHSVLFQFDISHNIVRGQNLIILTYFDRLSTEPIIVNVPIISVMSAKCKDSIGPPPSPKTRKLWCAHCKDGTSPPPFTKTKNKENFEAHKALKLHVLQAPKHFLCALKLRTTTIKKSSPSSRTRSGKPLFKL